MDDFPRRVRVTYNRGLMTFSIRALDGPRRGKIIDYADNIYLGKPIINSASVRERPYAPIAGEWLPSPVGGCVRLSIDEDCVLPIVATVAGAAQLPG